MLLTVRKVKIIQPDMSLFFLFSDLSFRNFLKSAEIIVFNLIAFATPSNNNFHIVMLELMLQFYCFGRILDLRNMMGIFCPTVGLRLLIFNFKLE